ncbi:MAG: type I secretion system protein TolC [Betaproteobacteria bacterium]|nr:type I secretion system protein TolC [Betaproteobacteria bacterium]
MLCTLGGCASLQSPVGARASEAALSADAAPAMAWWAGAGDPLLARLIDNGLAADPLLGREARALAELQARPRHWRFRVASWIDRILQQTPEAPEFPEVQAVRLADARQRKAARIARAYVEVRRLQASLALRQVFQYQFHDDADFARWRHEAGLVSAVDGGLAASLVGVNAGALADIRARLAAAEATLARRAALAPSQLALWLDDGAQVPRLDADGAAAAACDDARAAGPRAALTEAREREGALPKLERDAERTADDARAAYRLGTGDFATLYVAQTAVLAVREARIAAQARRARAAINLWTDAGLRRNQAGLREPARSPAGDVPMAARDGRG